MSVHLPVHEGASLPLAPDADGQQSTPRISIARWPSVPTHSTSRGATVPISRPTATNKRAALRRGRII